MPSLPYPYLRLIVRASLICLIGIVSLTSTRAQPTSPPVDSVSPAAPEPVRLPAASDFGIVIRLSETLLQPKEPSVSRTTPVREMVAGACSVGTADTTGQLTVDFKPKSDGIAMNLIFQGTSVSQTVVRQSSARISSKTSTRVMVSTPVDFHPASGFRSGRALSDAEVVKVCRNVVAEKRGLRGLVVRRAAKKKLAEKQHEIRHACEQSARKQVATDTKSEVDRQLERWNQQWATMRQMLGGQAWYREDSNTFLTSDEHHVHVFIRAAADGLDDSTAAGPPIPFPPKQLPAAEQGSLFEIIFYEDKQTKQDLAALLSLVEATIRQHMADLPISDSLSIDTIEGTRWVKLSVTKNDSSAPVRQLTSN